MRQAALIYNPIAGRRRTERHSGRLVEIFAREGWSVEPVATRKAGGGEVLARAAADRGVDAVFALGGDGTLRECAAGILGSETALGFLPSGTTNVMSLALGLPNNPFRAARALARGRSGRLDVGLCGGTPFLMQTSAGIDAAVLGALNPRTKRLLGKGAVATAAIRTLARYGFPEFEVEIDGERRTVTFAAICNIPFYGGPFKMTREARIDDGRLHAALFSGRGRGSTLAFTVALLLARHRRRRDVEIVPVEEIGIPAVPGLTVQMDGDAFPDILPTRVRLAPESIRVLVPR